MKKVLKGILVFLVSVIVLALLYNYLFISFVPVYNFPENIKFSGDKWYNPYKDFDNATYNRANFHGHSKIGPGILNGRNNSTDDVYKAYRDLGYTFISVSNYHTIVDNKTYYDFSFIPAQEYGINISKSHILLIGSQKREFLDSMLYQDANVIQSRINRVKKTNEIVVLAHPDFVRAVSVEEAGKLSNYDLMEVINVFAHSLKQWDSALSNGRPAFLLASDDTHNVFKNTDYGRNITMVPLNADNFDKLYTTLKNGSAYAVSLPHTVAVLDRPEKKKILDNLPSLVYIHEDNDNISIKLSKKADKIVYSTDNGTVLKTFENTDSAVLKAEKDNSYIRISAVFDNDTLYYFNPIIRTNDGLKPDMPKVTKNVPLYALKITVAFIILALISYFVTGIVRKYSRKN